MVKPEAKPKRPGRKRSAVADDAAGKAARRALRVQDIPAAQRPRELFDRVGPYNLSDEQLLAIILRSGVHGLNVLDVARDLLARFGSLGAMARAPFAALAGVPGVGRVRAQVLKAALVLGERLTSEKVEPEAAIRSPEAAACLLRERVRSREVESFWILALDAKHRLQSEPIEITRGLLDASLAHPREVFRQAILLNSAAVVLVHNHPSGDPTPSPEDIRLTRQLIEAGRIIDIRVLDHIILGRPSSDGSRDFCSLREAGVVQFAE